MPAIDRAAQFAPFAALTGYSDAIDETARLTDKQIDLSEDEKLRLNEKLQIVCNSIGNKREFIFTYFVPDKYKSGGAYLSCRSCVKKIDMLQKSIVLVDQIEIPIERIIDIEVI